MKLRTETGSTDLEIRTKARYKQWPKRTTLGFPTYPMPMQNCLRVYRDSPTKVAVQIRTLTGYAHAELSINEALQLARALRTCAKEKSGPADSRTGI